ncbi:MAG: hypothetical protein HY904_19145 [Deltaproteobacteria bacterium]|nr:hypothetical protein [Deltaproteobacteria bacterium]
MIALIDPAFFAARTDGPDRATAVQHDVGLILEFLKETQAQLVAVEDYWRPLWMELIRPIEHRYPEVRPWLTELRKRALQRHITPLTDVTRVWGFRLMFDCAALFSTSAWVDRMSRSVLRLASLNEPIVLIARPVVGRNIRRHQTGNIVIDEVTRWRLYVQPGTSRHVPVPCVARPRHVQLPWTARFDWRLPACEDAARYPFCPPPEWWKGATAAVQTRSGKPSFVDGLDNAWTRPNIPGGAGYHWDVFISKMQLLERIGDKHINVVAFGGPPDEGTPGSIHHRGQDQAKLNDQGWTCA